MRFWDSSAIVPLICEEEQTQKVKEILKIDSHMTVWAFTSLEIISAIQRKSKNLKDPSQFLAEAQERLTVLKQAWSQVSDYHLVRDRAERVVRTHSLRAADACQLAAAILLVQEKTSQLSFVSLDKELLEAARKEGFKTVNIFP